MKKRKNQKEAPIINESTHYDINDVQIQQVENYQQHDPQKYQKNRKEQEILNSEQHKNTQKTCAQSLKEKLQYFWIQMVNYLQFDRVLSNDEIQLLRKEDYTIKTRYPDNYYLTYKERQKSFGIALQEIKRMKMQEQQIKNKNFWNQLKRFICCQGGNQLQENDQMLTAASQTEYFYRTKENKKHENSIQMTEQALVQKDYPKMLRQEQNLYEKQLFSKSNNNNKDKKINSNEDQLINQKKLIDSHDKNKNNKLIDMNNIKTIKKDIKEDKLVNDSKKQKNNLSRNQKVIENNTQKVYIHKKQNIDSLNEQQQQIDEVFMGNNINQNNKIQRNKTQKKNKTQINRTQNNNNNNNNSTQNNTKENNKQGVTNFNDNTKTQQSNQNKLNILNSTTNPHKQSKQLKDQQTTYPSSLNPSAQKLTAQTVNSTNANQQISPNSSKHNQNPDLSQSINNQTIQINQQQNKQIPDDLKIKKNKKRTKAKQPKQESFFDLKLIENLDNNQISNNLENQSADNDQERKKYSSSTQQISKKAKKRPFNPNYFQQVVNEGLQDEENNLQQSFNMQFGSNNDKIMTGNSSGIQLAKKKKTRNKKMFNLQQQNEKSEQVIIFDQNQQQDQQFNNNSNTYANTKQLGSDLNSYQTSSSPNIKKRKKVKKLKDFNAQNDVNGIVLQGDENTNENMNDQTIQNSNNFSTINPQGFSGPIKADKKRKKKTRLREQIQKQQQQFDIVDLGEIN